MAVLRRLVQLVEDLTSIKLLNDEYKVEFSFDRNDEVSVHIHFIHLGYDKTWNLEPIVSFIKAEFEEDEIVEIRSSDYDILAVIKIK